MVGDRGLALKAALIEKVAGALALDIGTVRRFGRKDIGARGLASGWATPEEAHCWNDGPEAVLSLATAPPDFRCVLVIEVVPLINAAAAKQDVTFFGNGLRLGFWRLTTEEPAQLEALIEPKCWRLQDGAAILDLAVNLPDSLRLSRIQSNGDDRELGLCFRTLALFPAPQGH